jgi:hypothetical protein
MFLIIRLQPGKIKLGAWCFQVVAVGFGKVQKGFGHHGANNMGSGIQGVGVAVAISKKPGTDMVAAWLQGRA